MKQKMHIFKNRKEMCNKFLTKANQHSRFQKNKVLQSIMKVKRKKNAQNKIEHHIDY